MFCACYTLNQHTGYFYEVPLSEGFTTVTDNFTALAFTRFSSLLNLSTFGVVNNSSWLSYRLVDPSVQHIIFQISLYIDYGADDFIMGNICQWKNGFWCWDKTEQISAENFTCIRSLRYFLVYKHLSAKRTHLFQRFCSTFTPAKCFKSLGFCSIAVFQNISS